MIIARRGFRSLLLLSVVLGGRLLSADVPVGPSGSESEEMARVEALPASRIPLKGATLSSAVRLLAAASHLSYLAPPEADFAERVTSDVTMNPFKLLQVLAENYGFGMDFHQGLWRFYRINLNEMVTKSYTLRFDNLENVSISSSNLNSQLSAASSSSSSSSMSSSSSSGSSGSAGPASSNFSQTQFTRESKTSKIIENVRKILSIPTVSIATPNLDDSPLSPGAAATQRGVPAPTAEPIWNPDTSQLFVVATRQQHSLIASYLKTIDRPQKLIKISVRFVETQRDPHQTMGVDWSQSFLGSGGPVSLSGLPPVSGSLSQAVSSGVLPLATTVDLTHPSSTKLPVSVLSAPALQLTLQAIANDKRSSIVQDPVIFTSNNREVTFKSTTEEPIQQGSTTFGSATAATSSQITYIEIGTQLSVMPSLLPGEGEGKEVVLLNLSINVSSIIGQQVIGGNPYPVTSNRTYSYSVPIPNGKTLAIAGLEERSRAVTDSKVPLFGDIPLIGYLFKSRDDNIAHTTLLAFITPDVIPSDQSVTDGALPSFRHRVFQGSETETMAQIDETLAGLPADIEALRAAANSANRETVLNRFDRMGVELSLIDVRLGELKMSDRLTARLAALNERIRDQLSHARDQVAQIGRST